MVAVSVVNPRNSYVSTELSCVGIVILGVLLMAVARFASGLSLDLELPVKVPDDDLELDDGGLSRPAETFLVPLLSGDSKSGCACSTFAMVSGERMVFSDIVVVWCKPQAQSWCKIERG